jgi:beta-lactamase class A
VAAGAKPSILLLAILVLAGCGDGGETTTTRSGPVTGTATTAPADEPRNESGRVVSPAGLRELEEFARDAPGAVAVAFAPLGGGEPVTVGSADTGRAWSTMKVPLLVTLIDRLGGAGKLSAGERAQAEAALTESDNEAAQALFGRLESLEGGLAAASRAIEETLRRAGDDATRVNTKPSSQGFSTYGQTEWSAEASTRFFAALAENCLLGRADTDYVLSLMEEVIPAQRWGIGEAPTPAGAAVAFKGGWGPEDDGGYLVRQGGAVTAGEGGYAFSVIAIPDERGSASFAAGRDLVSAATARLAELAGAGPPTTVSCPR